MRNIIDWKLYDKLTVATGGTQLNFTFFKQQTGGTVTLETTNLDLAGQIPKLHEFVIQQIVVRAIPAVAQINAYAYVLDQVALTHAGHLQLFIGGGRPFFQDTMLGVIGGGLAGMIATADSSVNKSMFYAQARIFESAKLEYMPKIDWNTAFEVKIDYPAAPTLVANTVLEMKLLGKLVRPNSA